MHVHNHAPAGPNARRAELGSLFAAFALALAIAIWEGIGGLISGSLLQRADAGHVLTDASGLLLSLVACWLATRPADPRRTFGYYRLEILAAAANGMLLIGIAGSIVYAAWGRLHEVRLLDLKAMAEFATGGFVANLIGLFVLTRQSHRTLNLKAAVLHIASDVASSLLVVATAGLMALTHWTFLDPVLSVAIAAAIVYGAVRILAEAVDILLEAVPKHLDPADILHHLEKADGVQAVHDLHLWTISSGLYALSAHLVVGGCDIRDCDALLTRVKEDLNASFGINHTTLQLESDAYEHREEIH